MSPGDPTCASAFPSPLQWLQVGASIGMTQDFNHRMRSIWSEASWGNSGSTTLSPFDGTLAALALEGAELGWCDARSWQLTALTVDPAGGPRAELTGVVQAVADDIVATVTVQASGPLSPGLPALELHGAEIWGEYQPCLGREGYASGGTVWPWHSVRVESNQPVDPLAEHLEATLDGAPIDLTWEPPDGVRSVTATIPGWLDAMGKELEVGLDGAPDATVAFTIAALVPELAFAGDTLDSLVSNDTGLAVEIVDGTQKLHVYGDSCSGIRIGGVLEARGKSTVVIEIEVGGQLPMVSGLAEAAVVLIHADGSRQTLPVAIDPAPATYELALDGDDLVGVEITAHGGCQAMSWWGPNIYVTAIRAE